MASRSPDAARAGADWLRSSPPCPSARSRPGARRCRSPRVCLEESDGEPASSSAPTSIYRRGDREGDAVCQCLRAGGVPYVLPAGGWPAPRDLPQCRAERQLDSRKQVVEVRPRTTCFAGSGPPFGKGSDQVIPPPNLPRIDAAAGHNASVPSHCENRRGSQLKDFARQWAESETRYDVSSRSDTRSPRRSRAKRFGVFFGYRTTGSTKFNSPPTVNTDQPVTGTTTRCGWRSVCRGRLDDRKVYVNHGRRRQMEQAVTEWLPWSSGPATRCSFISPATDEDRGQQRRQSDGTSLMPHDMVASPCWSD